MSIYNIDKGKTAIVDKNRSDFFEYNSFYHFHSCLCLLLPSDEQTCCIHHYEVITS